MSAQVAAILRQALAAFGPNGENWVNHAPEFDTVTHCMLSALPVTPCDEVFPECEIFLVRALGLPEADKFRNGDIARWNDQRGRTWPEVKEAYVKAIQLAEVSP